MSVLTSSALAVRCKCFHCLSTAQILQESNTGERRWAHHFEDVIDQAGFTEEDRLQGESPQANGVGEFWRDWHLLSLPFDTHWYEIQRLGALYSLEVKINLPSPWFTLFQKGFLPFLFNERKVLKGILLRQGNLKLPFKYTPRYLVLWI